MTTQSDAKQILLLEDQPGQAKYLELALRNPNTTTDRWKANAEVWDVSDWRDLKLEDIDLVILCNVSSLPEQLPNLLRDYVQRGGKLLGFLGDRIDPPSYRRFTDLDTNSSSAQNFFPLQLTSPSPSAIHALDPRNYESSFLKIFRDFPDSGLLTTPIFRYWKLDSSLSLPSYVQIDLATSDNDPLLVTYPFGNGSVAWWLTSPTPQPATIGDPEPWNAMAAWPSFLPLIREQVNFLTRPGENQAQRLVRVPLLGYLPPEFTDEQLNILRPDRKVETVRPLPPQQDGFRPWAYDNSDLPGFYELQTSQPLSNSESCFAVNVDTRESDLTSDAAQKYQKWLSPAGLDPGDLTSPNTSLKNNTEASTQNTEFSSPLSQKPIFHWFLGALLGLLITESLVAFWLGRSRA